MSFKQFKGYSFRQSIMVQSKIVEGFDKYEIYDDGRIFSKRQSKFMKPKTATGYAMIRLVKDDGTNKTQYIHRLIGSHFLPPPDREDQVCIDHKNHNRLDNRVENLRWASYRENQFNRQVYNMFGCKGVYWHGKNLKFVVRLTDVDGIKKYYGSFENLEDAIETAVEVTRINHGQFFCDKIKVKI